MNSKADGAYSNNCKTYWILETYYDCQTYISTVAGAPEVVAKRHRTLKLVGAVRNILEVLQACFSCQQYIRTVRSLTSVARRPAVFETYEKLQDEGTGYS
jgi:hypothetical protein